MSSNFNPLLWFVCRHCRQAFPDTDKLRKHKIRKHFQDCSSVKCIVFEERLLGKPWIPTNNFFPEAAPGSKHGNELEILLSENDCNCKCRCNPLTTVSVSVQTEELNSLANPEPQQKPKLKPIPLVVAKRLTQGEINPYISQTTNSSVVTELQSTPVATLKYRKDGNKSPRKDKNRSPSTKQNETDDANLDRGSTDSEAAFPEFPSTNLNSDSASEYKTDIHELASDKSIVADTALNVDDASSYTSDGFKLEIDDPISPRPCFDDLNSVPELVSQAFADPSSDSVQDDNLPRLLTSEKRRKPNPYVLVRRLTTAELNVYSKGNKCSTLREPQPSPNKILRGTKRSSECLLNNSSENKTKKRRPDLQVEKYSSVSNLDANKSTSKWKNTMQESNNEELIVAKNEDVLDSVFNHFEAEAPATPVSSYYDPDDDPEQASPITLDLDNEDIRIPDISEISNDQVQFGVTEADVNSELGLIASTGTTDGLLANFVAGEPDRVESEDEGSIRIISVSSHPQYFENKLATEATSNFASPASGTSKNQKQSPKSFTKGRNYSTQTFTGTSSLDSKSATSTRTRTSGRNRPQIIYSEDFNCKNCSVEFDTAEELTEHEAMCPSISISSNTDDRITENQVNSQSVTVLQSVSQTAASTAHVIYKIPKGIPIPAPLLPQLNAQLELRPGPAAKNNSANQEEVLEEQNDDRNDSGSDCILESENYSESDSESNKKKQTGKKKKGQQQKAKRKLNKSSKSSTFNLNPLQVSLWTTPIETAESNSELGSIHRDNLLPWLRWLAHYQQQQATMEERFRNVLRLDPDPIKVSAQDHSFSIGPKNPVTCKLCEAKLDNAFDLRNHVENCWIHNKVRHLYCTICETSFYRSSITLAAARLNYRSHTFDTHPEKSDSRESQVEGLGSNEPEESDPQGNDPPNNDPQDEDPQDNILPLIQWLKKQKENRYNYICLDPEPDSATTTLRLAELFATPIKCKLCLQLLTSDVLLRNHVKVCYQNNKNKHVYCVICDKTYTNNVVLQSHCRKMHGPKKNKSEALWFCNACPESFTTEADFTRHKKSLQDFLKSKMITTEFSTKPTKAVAAVKKKKKKRIEPTAAVAVSDTEAIPDPDSEVVVEWASTFSYISEVIKFYRQFKSPDGSKNIILLDPEPGPNDYRHISYENRITCRLCSKKLTQRKSLYNHARTCWLKNRECHRYCITCEKTFKKSEKLLEHNRVTHPEKLRTAFKCKVCLQEYFDPAVFEQHEEAHKDPNFLPFKCPLGDCDLSFKDERSLEKHVSDHRDKLKCFRCRLCPKSYGTSPALSIHLRSHTGARPFICEVQSCGASFRTATGLAQHTNRKHITELGLSQDHLCSTCGKAFVTLYMLNQHVNRVHAIKAKVYKCPHEGCSKAFSHKGQFTEHEREHTGEKPFQCDTCGQAFAKQWSFTKHQRSHEGTLNRAVCHLCPRKFLGSWELKQHLTKVHEGAPRNDHGNSTDSDGQ